MKVLIVKTTSLGDIIHTLPALTDAGNAIPGIQFDWVVEQPFAEIPTWHPLVDKVIPVAIRRWRKQPLRTLRSTEWQHCYAALRNTQYDMVIDAQGLIKSALLSRLAKGTRVGLDFQSAKESAASLFYHKTYAVDPQQHAVTRGRQLLGLALGYPVPATSPDYGLDRQRFASPLQEDRDYLVFLHGTTWSTKHWPGSYWRQLAKRVIDAGYPLYLPWGNELERQRAERIVANLPHAELLPRMSLREIAGVLAQAKAIVAVDTGLGHLAAALNRPTVNLYGPTDPIRTGTVGTHQVHLAAHFACAPCLQKTCRFKGAAIVQPACFAQVSPKRVWQALQQFLS